MGERKKTFHNTETEWSINGTNNRDKAVKFVIIDILRQDLVVTDTRIPHNLKLLF